MADVIDNLMIFRDRLSDAEASTLLRSTTAAGGLPSPPGRMVWHATFDAGVSTTLNGTATGRRVSSGADANGFIRVLAALRGPVVDEGTAGVKGPVTTRWEAMAALATTDLFDTAADLHSQFVADAAQHTRVR